jgi:hypothetical protein
LVSLSAVIETSSLRIFGKMLLNPPDDPDNRDSPNMEFPFRPMVGEVFIAGPGSINGGMVSKSWVSGGTKRLEIVRSNSYSPW